MKSESTWGSLLVPRDCDWIGEVFPQTSRRRKHPKPIRLAGRHPRSLTNELSRLAPHLRTAGIMIEGKRSRGRRLYEVRSKVMQTAKPCLSAGRARGGGYGQ